MTLKMPPAPLIRPTATPVVPPDQTMLVDDVPPPLILPTFLQDLHSYTLIDHIPPPLMPFLTLPRVPAWTILPEFAHPPLSSPRLSDPKLFQSSLIPTGTPPYPPCPESDHLPQSTQGKHHIPTQRHQMRNNVKYQTESPRIVLGPQMRASKTKRQCESMNQKQMNTCRLEDKMLWINGKMFPLDKLENAYSMTPHTMIILFRGEKKIHYTFDHPGATIFVNKLLTRAVGFRWKDIDEAIEKLLRESMADSEIKPGSFVGISESLLGNSTQQTAKVLWANDDLITVQLPGRCATLPKWYVTGMIDPYEIVRLRTFARKILSAHNNSWESTEEVPDIKILREMVTKTVHWIVEDNFEKWRDEFFIQGNELNKTEVTILVDQKLVHLYLKEPLSQLWYDADFQRTIHMLDEMNLEFWTIDVSQKQQFKRGVRRLLCQEQKHLYARIISLTRMIEEYEKACNPENDKIILNYLLFSFVKASSMLPQNFPTGGISIRSVLNRLDLHLMLELVHPEFLSERHCRSLRLFSQVFDALEDLASRS